MTAPCPSCGVALPEAAVRFCLACGHRLPAASDDTVPPHSADLGPPQRPGRAKPPPGRRNLVPGLVVLAILGARGVSVTQCDEPHELVTPTGAAIAITLLSVGGVIAVVAVRIAAGVAPGKALPYSRPCTVSTRQRRPRPMTSTGGGRPERGRQRSACFRRGQRGRHNLM